MIRRPPRSTLSLHDALPIWEVRAVERTGDLARRATVLVPGRTRGPDEYGRGVLVRALLLQEGRDACDADRGAGIAGEDGEDGVDRADGGEGEATEVPAGVEDDVLVLAHQWSQHPPHTRHQPAGRGQVG